MLSILHRAPRRCFGSRSWRQPGHGGTFEEIGGATEDFGGASEEVQIAQSLRTIRGREYPVVVEVMNACHVDWAARQLPLKRVLWDAAGIWIRVLTHADRLSDRALRHQMERASATTPETRRNDALTDRGDGRRRHQIPVVALNLRGVEAFKVRRTLPVMNMLAGAKILMDACRGPSGDGDADGDPPTGSLLVCGLANAGKSSLIHPLTKGWTLAKKKKKDWHLPSVNALPGWTLEARCHVFEAGGASVSLMDTPGLRPRLEGLSTGELAVWLATRSMRPMRGMLRGNTPRGQLLCEKIVAVLWGGLRRHARISSQPFRFESPEALRSIHFEGRGAVHMEHLIQACASGKYGGMLIEDESPPAPAHGEQALLSIDFDRTVVARNQAAVLLTDIGAGREDVGNAKNSALFMPRRRLK